MFGEHAGTIGDFADPTYSEPVVRAWNNKIKEGHAFVIITPEYNHSIPGVLKTALDSVFVSFGLRHKPIAAVGYSSAIGGGVRAIEHLAHMVIEADAVPLRGSVIIPNLASTFADGLPTHPATDIALTIMLDDLAWWSKALEHARAREPPPAVFRMRAPSRR
jgi:NAD(P)H-dependent FMN reductase